MSTTRNPFSWRQKSVPKLLALEPRMLFDGAAVAVVAETANQIANADQTQAISSQEMATERVQSSSEVFLQNDAAADDKYQGESITNLLASVDPAQGGYVRSTPGATEIMFIDSAVQGKEVLLAGTRSGVEIVLLGTDQNAWQQMTEVIAQHHNVTAVHIVSHGTVGDIVLNGKHYTAQSLQSESSYLQKWQPHLTESADILIYGCEIGAEVGGQLLINTLASITQADVAASNDTTGSAALGGDWTLETRTGMVDAAVFASDAAMAQYDYALGAPSNTVPNTTSIPLVVAPDTSLVFSGGNAIAIADADNNLISANMTVLHGTLSVTLSGAATIGANENGSAMLTISGSQTDINATLATLAYRGSAGYHGPDTLSLVSTDATSLTATSTIDISVDAVLPTLVVDTTKTVAENATASQLTSTATVTDSDSDNFNGGEIRLTGLDAADVLSIASGSGVGAIRRDGSNLQLSDGATWTTIGTVSGGVGSTFRVTFTSVSVDAVVVQNVIKAITFYNNSDNPTTSRTLSMRLFDSDGGPSTAQSIAVSVTPANDAPTVTLDSAKTVVENDPASLLTSAATITDVDSASLNGGVLMVSGLATADVLTISTSDNNTSGAIWLSGTSVMLGQGSSSAAIGTLSGGSGATLTITFNSAAVTPVVAESVLRAITFYNNSETPVASRTLTVSLSDAAAGSGGLTSAQKTMVINVTAVNDAPVLTVNSTLTVSEQTSVALASTATVSDVDSTNFNTGVLTVSGLDTSDLIGISTTTNNTSGAIWLNGTNVMLGQGSSSTVIASLSGGSGTTLRITFSSSLATPAVVENVVRALTFRNTADNPIASRTLNITISDGGGGLSTTQQILVGVTTANDAPVISDPTTSITLYTAAANTSAPTNGQAVGRLLSEIFSTGRIIDPDGTTTNNLGVAITAIGPANNIAGVYYSTNNGTNWVGIGQGDLNSITKVVLLANTSTTRLYFQAKSGATGGQTGVISFRAWDMSAGTAVSTVGAASNAKPTTIDTTTGYTTALSASTVNVDVNLNSGTSPTNTLPNFNATEDTSVALSGISIADTTLSDPYTITLSVAAGNGTLSATGTPLVTVTGTGSSTLTLSGTLANLNSYLGSADAPTYLGAPNATSNVTLNMLTRENSGLTASSNSTITISAVNDAPLADINGSSSGFDNIATFTEGAGGDDRSFWDVVGYRFGELDFTDRHAHGTA